MHARTLPILALTLALAGCQTWGPTWSEVTGNRFHRVEMNRMAATIERIDGTSAFPAGPNEPIRIEPGKRVLTLGAVPPSLVTAGGWQLQQWELNAEPCKRYYINAQWDSRIGSQWTPVIDEVETIAGCDPAAKAK
jgi:hypothetical protein